MDTDTLCYEALGFQFMNGPGPQFLHLIGWYKSGLWSRAWLIRIQIPPIVTYQGPVADPGRADGDPDSTFQDKIGSGGQQKRKTLRSGSDPRKTPGSDPRKTLGSGSDPRKTPGSDPQITLGSATLV